MGQLIALSESDRQSVARFLDAAPLDTVMLRDLLDARFGAADRKIHLFGYKEGDEWLGVAGYRYVLAVHAPDPRAIEPLAVFAASRVLQVPELVARTETVEALWQTLQYFPYPVAQDHTRLVLTLAPGALASELPAIAPATEADLDHVAALLAEMSSEGGRPVAPDDPALLADIRPLLAQGRYFLVKEDGQPMFLAAVASLTPHYADIAQVFVPRSRRGQGLGLRGMAGVSRSALAIAPAVSLSVNVDNTSALALYEKLGYRRESWTQRMLSWHPAEVPAQA